MPDTSSITHNAISHETIDRTDTSLGKGLLRDSYNVGPTKRRLSHKIADYINRIKCLGKTASTLDSSVSTAISDELAAIYGALSECRLFIR